MRKVLGVIAVAVGIGLGVGLTWIKGWTVALVWAFGGLLGFGFYMLDPTDFIAFLKALPGRFTASA